jgi:hypothetical protein
MRSGVALLGAMCVIAGAVQAQQPGATVPVTVDNFIRAETDLYLGNGVKDSGGIGKLGHKREMMPIDKQLVIRSNRDTLYSSGVFDLDAGAVTVALPEAGTRFRSLMVVNQDHYIVGKVEYGAGSFSVDKAKAGTRYALIAIRTFVDPNDPQDVAKAHALQDATKVNQQGTGKFEVPNWDAASQKKVRDALLVLGSTTSGFTGAFGNKGKVDPVYHLIGTAAGWGGNPQQDAIYLGENPPKNDGKTVHRLTVKDVPVDGFWSISVYNEQGYFVKNDLNAYSLNNVTARKSADGSYTIQFGGCDGKVANCLPITQGWNYTVRLYRPRASVVDGTWKFPMAQPLG